MKKRQMITTFCLLLAVTLSACAPAETQNPSEPEPVSSSSASSQISQEVSSRPSPSSQQEERPIIDYDKVVDVETTDRKIFYLLEDGSVYGEGPNNGSQEPQPVKMEFPEPQITNLTLFAAIGQSGTVYTWYYDSDTIQPKWFDSFEFSHKVKQMEYSPSTDIYLLTELGELYTIGRASLYGSWYPADVPEEIKDVPIKVNIPEKFQSIELSNGLLYALGESGKLYYACTSFRPNKPYSLDTAVFRQVNFSKPIKQFLDVELKRNFENGIRILTEDGEIYFSTSQLSNPFAAHIFTPAFQKEEFVSQYPKGELEGKKIVEMRSYPGRAWYLFLEDGTIWRNYSYSSVEPGSPSPFFKADDDHLRIGKLEYPITLNHS